MNRAEILRGAVLALACQTISFCTVIFLPGNAMAACMAFVVVPTALMLLITQRFQFAIAFAFLNDVYSGGSGTWVKIGPVSGRWLLFLVFCIVIALTAHSEGKRRSRLTHWHSLAVLLFGVALPVVLLVRSAFAANIVVDKGIGDVAFLSILLTYYTFRELLAKFPGLLLGWIVGASAGLVAILLLMSVGPEEYRSQIVMGVIGDVRFGNTVSGVSRVSPVQTVLVLFPFFLAFNALVLQRLTIWTSILTIAAALIAVAPLAVIYLRGPLLACGITVLITLTVGASARKLNKTGRIAGAFLVVAALVTATMVVLVPEEAGANFDVSRENWFEHWLGASRMYQHREMLAAVENSPWLGAGLGSPITAFGGTETTDFEMQYHMLLYRFGVLAFGFFMSGVAWVVAEPFRFWRRRLRGSVGPFDIWSVSCLAATIGVLIAGAFNPYLRAPFAPLFLVLYLCTKERIVQERTRADRVAVARRMTQRTHAVASRA